MNTVSQFVIIHFLVFTVGVCFILFLFCFLFSCLSFCLFVLGEVFFVVFCFYLSFCLLVLGEGGKVISH